MFKVNRRDITERRYDKEGRLGFGTPISEALGRIPASTDALERHPFDVEILRVPPHCVPWRFHSHSAQWEFYYVVSGHAVIRDAAGKTEVVVGDAFIFKPGEPHQIFNESDADCELMVIADNPTGESYHYPDEAMWVVNSPDRHYVVVDKNREPPA